MDWFDCKASLDSPSFTGNVGIGTATPRGSLDVSYGTGGQAVFGAIPAVVGQSGNEYPTFGYNIAFTGSGNIYNYLASDTAYGIRLGNDNRIGFLVAGPGTAGSAISFLELMSINAGGHVGIGTTSPSYTLEVNGSVAGTSWTATSDARLKKNIAPIRDALALLNRMQGVRYDWRLPRERSIGKSLNLPVGSPQVGFIAQELKWVLPEAVSVANDKDHTMSVAESKVDPVLVEAVKELQAINAHQDLEIAGLHREMAALARKVAVRTASK